MPTKGLNQLLAAKLDEMKQTGRLKKAEEAVIRGTAPPVPGKGRRYLLEGEGERPFLRMNSNSYLGMSARSEVIAAEEAAVREFGTGPGAVRFISGSWSPHARLERRLARFHGREAAMLFSSAYATVMGVLPPLITDKTAVISDALNHSCIISNAIALARPAEKAHLSSISAWASWSADTSRCAAKTCARAIIVTDGIFSMRGDHAPLDRIMALARQYDGGFAENAIVVVDDSHGVGAFGPTGRGTEEYTKSGAVDILVATLGKAFGVNGGYVTGADTIVRYLRETSPFYVYSNPITPAEAAAALRAVELVDGPIGIGLLAHLRAMTERFKAGLVKLGFETLPGEHPVIPLMLRDTTRTSALVAHLRGHAGILATGTSTSRSCPGAGRRSGFQISADHVGADIEEALDALRGFAG